MSPYGSKRHSGSLRARADNKCLIPSEVVANVRRLLQEYQEIPVFLLCTLYNAKYNKILDCIDLGFSDGLMGFLEALGGMIELRSEKKLRYVCLARKDEKDSSLDWLNETKENTPTIELMLKKRPYHEELFMSSSFLWANRNFARLLNKNDIVIEKSGFELACECSANMVRLEQLKIARYLSQYNKGVGLHEMNLRVNRRVFNLATSLNALTLEMPEIFYRQQTDATSKALIFDGTKQTINLDGELKRQDTRELDSKLVTKAINSGLYQKTLLLIRETGVRGLKLNVWHASIMRNFYGHESAEQRERIERDLYEIDPLQFFMALARDELVELGSPSNCKNDLRAFLPRKPVEYIELRKRHKDLLNYDDLSQLSTDLPTRIGAARRRIVAISSRLTSQKPIY